MKFLTILALLAGSLTASGCSSLSGRIGTKAPEGALPRLEAHSTHGHSPRGVSIQFTHTF
jgi:hypothetical protein